MVLNAVNTAHHCNLHLTQQKFKRRVEPTVAKIYDFTDTARSTSN